MSPADTLKVLIVDDNAINLKVGSLVLSRMQCQCDCAQSGQQAIDKALAADYDLILMDLSMPVMDGATAAQQIRETRPNGSAPMIVALTAFNIADECGHGTVFDSMLSKPITKENVATVLDAARQKAASR